MIWILAIIMVSSVGGVLVGLFDLGGALLMLLSWSVEELAGQRVAGAAMLVVILAGVGGVAYVLHADTEHDSDPRELTVPVGERTSAAPEPARSSAERPAHAAVRLRPRCGVGAPPRDVDRDSWPTYRCRAVDSSACLPWNAYGTRPEQGCPGTQLCCGPEQPLALSESSVSDN